MSYNIVGQLMEWRLSFRWKKHGQMKDKKVPVKLPMKPMRMVKCGMTTANTIVTMTMTARKPKPQNLSSPSRAQMEENIVSGFP